MSGGAATPWVAVSVSEEFLTVDSYDARGVPDGRYRLTVPPATAPTPGIVPGKMRCAKCKFSLQRVSLNVNVGTVTAGGNATEPCPNGCGPLWPVTWEQEAREGWKDAEALFERAHKAEKALEELQSRLGPTLVRPAG
jgi:hypothetical protein